MDLKDPSLDDDRNPVWWWEPPDQSLPFEFCRDTSLHGLKYLHQPERHLTERIFWLLMFLTGLIVAIVMITGVWQTYRDKPIIVAFEPFETTVDTIPFPAVTICNMNKVQKKNADRILHALEHGPKGSPNYRKAEEDVYLLHHVCNVSSGFSKTFNFSLQKGTVDDKYLQGDNNNAEQENQYDVEYFLRSASQKCPDMIPLCIWQDEVQNCTTLFNPIETDFGKCCTFNMISQTLLNTYLNDSRDDPEEVKEWNKWKLEDGLIFKDEDKKKLKLPRRQRRAGKTFGLSILLDPDLHEYFCTTSDAEGFRLATHLSTDVPHVADFGIAIAPNTEVFVNIRPEITVAEDAIGGFPLDKRLCYFPHEFPLEYYRYYTPSNCFDECIANKTFETCDCVRYYMPRDDKRKLCGPEMFACAEEVKKGISKSCDKCYRTCQEIQYMMETTSTMLDHADDNWMFRNRSFARWRYNNVTIVHLFIGQPSTYARVRKQLYNGLELMAQTGGLMGLCLGFSGLSLIEILYYFTLRPWLQRRRRQRLSSRMVAAIVERWRSFRGKKAGDGTARWQVASNAASEGKVKSRVGHGIPSLFQEKTNYNVAYGNGASSGYQYSNSKRDGLLLTSEIAPFYKAYERNSDDYLARIVAGRR